MLIRIAGVIVIACLLTGCSAWDTVDGTYKITRKAVIKGISLTEAAVKLNGGRLSEEEMQSLTDLRQSLIDMDRAAINARPALEKVLSRPK